MQCFEHDDRGAVGVCKSCGKGVCRECAVDMQQGLACRDRCEADVAHLIALIDRNIQLAPVSSNVLGNVRRNTYAHAIFALALGKIFILTGLWSGTIKGFPGLAGAVFLLYGGYMLWRGQRVPH